MPATRVDVDDPEHAESDIGNPGSLSRGTSSGNTARLKGKRGPSRTSCAECRRLKLKCDGQVPCSQCMKRGYAALCPDGACATGRGRQASRNLTTELRVKLVEFAERIQQLEEALRVAHAAVSHALHPLLSDELLRIKESIAAPLYPRMATGGASSSQAPEPNADLLDRFGSLSISLSGGSKHFGHGANSWWLMHNEEAIDDDSSPTAFNLVDLLPAEILAQTGSFPLALVSHPYQQTSEDHLRLLLAFIPPEEIAVELRDSAFLNAFCGFCPIPMEQYQSQIHSFVYESETLQVDDCLTASRLAVFFTVLAVGALLLKSLPERSPQAETFHQLARAALMKSRLVEEPTVEGIQALFLISLYMNMSDTANRETSNTRWSMAGLLTKIAHVMGLHHDPNRFGITGEEATRRRMLFCELFAYDMAQAILFGRPPTIGRAYNDVQLYVVETTPSIMEYHAWKFKFSSECLSLVHLEAYAAAAPSYATVHLITRRMEAYEIWDPPNQGLARESTDRVLQRYLAQLKKPEVILHINRPFFAKATSEHKDDPLKSEYGASVIAAYRSAHQIISLVQRVYSQAEHPVRRIWFFWPNLFGAGLVLGALIARSPQLTFAREALDQLRVACDLFSRVYIDFSAEKVYEKLIVARDKAQASLLGQVTGQPQSSLRAADTSNDPDDVLSHLGARTRTITRQVSVPANNEGAVPDRCSAIHHELAISLPTLSQPLQMHHLPAVEHLQALSPPIEMTGSGLPQSASARDGHIRGQYRPGLPDSSHSTAATFAFAYTWPEETLGLPSSDSADYAALNQCMDLPSLWTSQGPNKQSGDNHSSLIPPTMHSGRLPVAYPHPSFYNPGANAYHATHEGLHTRAEHTDSQSATLNFAQSPPDLSEYVGLSHHDFIVPPPSDADWDKLMSQFNAR